MKIKNLYFQHHKEAPYFFKDLSLDLEEGLVHTLHGKNGVGKSVLLQILGRKTEKEAVISGEVFAEKVALIHQQFDQTLAGHFTFLENLQFGAFCRFPSPFSRLKKPSLLLQEESVKLLERFQIDPTIPVHKLSGGQRQILALLMKLQHQRTTLLLDEPTAALDEQNAIMVFEFLKTLKGVTLLVVCHDTTLARKYTTGTHLFMERNAQGIRSLEQIF